MLSKEKYVDIDTVTDLVRRAPDAGLLIIASLVSPAAT